MNLRTLFASFALALLVSVPVGAQTVEPLHRTELKALKKQVRDKVNEGKKAAEDFAAETAAFDALIQTYKQDSVAASEIAFEKSLYYSKVLNEPEKAKAIAAQIKKDYPGTKAAQFLSGGGGGGGGGGAPSADKTALAGMMAPELNFKWSSLTGMKNLSSLKGKVVVLDFWATWCGPCIASFPKMRELTEHYAGTDVVVIGVTSIQGKVMNLESSAIDCTDDPAREMELMKDFMKKHDTNWVVAFSEEKVFNTDYAVSGIPHVAIIAPDGKVRHNGLHPGMPHEEKTEMIDAILKEFRLKVPSPKST